MKLLTPGQILRQRESAACSLTNAEFSAVDLNRPFIPEPYTQLYHTEAYGELSNGQRLRYNQLYGLRTNEQFMLFESGFTNRVMSRLLKYLDSDDAGTLRQCLNILLEEERRHYTMFYALNKLCMPEIYTRRRYHFLRVSWLERVALGVACRYPCQLLSLIWLVLLMEEHAVRFSRDMMKDKATDNLGELESNFLLAHRLHLQDEAGHVHIDANIIDFVVDRSSQRRRKLNVRLLRALLRTTLKPKHAGINVIRHLLIEHAPLRSRAQRLENSIRALNLDPCLLPLLNEPAQRPITTALLATYPEFEQALVI
jgi:hypothetical protein